MSFNSGEMHSYELLMNASQRRGIKDESINIEMDTSKIQNYNIDWKTRVPHEMDLTTQIVKFEPVTDLNVLCLLKPVI